MTITYQNQKKKEYAIEAFKEAVKYGMFKGQQSIQLDSEIQRVIGNISHGIVMEEEITSLKLEYLILYEPIAKNKAIESIGKWFRDQINLYYVKKLSHYEPSLSDLNHEFTVKAIQINCLSGYVVNEKEIRLSTCYLISNDIAKEELITISKHMEQKKNNIDKVIDLIWK